MKAVLCIVVLLAVANAYTFYIETKQVTNQSSGSGEEFANNLKNDVDNAPQPSGYCTVDTPAMPITNQGMCGGPNSNIGFHYYLNWQMTSEVVYDFDMGFDFGWGGAMSFNGEWVYIDKSDIWWGGSDFNNGDVWNVRGLASIGENTIEIYGSEGCCDGAHNIRYRMDNGDWKSINDWSEIMSQCCCVEGHSTPCTCFGEDVDGSSCAEVCEGWTDCPEDELACGEVTFFSQCYQWGDSMVINGSEECLNWEPKSICIPEHKSVTLYNMCNFQGQEVTFETTQPCLEQIDYNLLAAGISVSGNKKSLKTAEPIRAVINDI